MKFESAQPHSLGTARLLVCGVDGNRGATACCGASLGPAHGSYLPAFSSSAEKLIAAIGLESRYAHSARHVECLQDLSCSRIDSPQIAFVIFQVPCQSSPSTQVTPVTKRFDSIVRRIAPVSGSI